jgi:hypothetical protein
MEKRSRRRTRDLVTQAASQGLSENEIGCARISMMARSTNAPCKGRIQMRKTNPLHFFTFGLQRTAGPYSWVKKRVLTICRLLPVHPMNGYRQTDPACLKSAAMTRHYEGSPVIQFIPSALAATKRERRPPRAVVKSE